MRAWGLHDSAAKLVTQAPKSRDCDMIARRCAAADEGTALVFNCQMGRGRTTTAMIIAALVRCRLHPQQQLHRACLRVSCLQARCHWCLQRQHCRQRHRLQHQHIRPEALPARHTMQR